MLVFVYKFPPKTRPTSRFAAKCSAYAGKMFSAAGKSLAGVTFTELLRCQACVELPKYKAVLICLPVSLFSDYTSYVPETLV